MRNRHKISLSISVAFVFFYTFPWLSLARDEQYMQIVDPMGNGPRRLLILAISVFLSSMLFFHYNLFWKEKLIRFKAKWLRSISNLLINFVLIFVLSVFFNRISSNFFEIRKTFFLFFFFRNLMIACVAWLVAYSYRVMEQSKQDRIKLLTLHKEKIETELAMLKNQIDPHFLFNSLNSLTGIIRETPKDAIQFVNHLSETFRYILEHNHNNLVPLHQELTFLDSYLYLLKVRFGKGLNVKINIDEKYLNKNLPHFGLQLLIENATKHNMVSLRKPLNIYITANEQGVHVENNLQPRNQSIKGYGIGLANLARHYEIHGSMTIEIVKTEKDFIVNLPLL